MSINFQKGSGAHIKFWKDLWLQGPIMERYPTLYTYVENQDVTVQGVTCTGQWQITMPPQSSSLAVEEYMTLMAELEEVPVQTNERQHDQPWWKWSKDGKYTIKSFYKMYEEGPHVISSISKIWKLRAPTWVMVFGWLMLNNKILTVDNLVKRGWELVSRCSLCKAQSESVSHIFGNCIYTHRVRVQLQQRKHYLASSQNFVQGRYKHTLLYSTNMKVKQMQIAMIFAIWKERCQRVFQEKEKTPMQLSAEIVQEEQLWFNRNVKLQYEEG